MMGRWALIRFLSPFFMRLLRGSRVSIWTKLALAGAAVYLLFPRDLIPDWLPIAGWLDDLVVAVAALAWVYGQGRRGKDDPKSRS